MSKEQYNRQAGGTTAESCPAAAPGQPETVCSRTAAPPTEEEAWLTNEFICPACCCGIYIEIKEPREDRNDR